uniref:peptidylprolyl isomerase n=1 Tax=Nelumbo nucifera TaxID=4432 RepID=A0A822XQ70_NELNU|nr:TPA_asm: hypothetical protein HUJ06_023286 [Nelumbo nucifera]
MEKMEPCYLLMIVVSVLNNSGDVTDLGERIKVHYRGKLTDGTVFDSSFERGDRIEFELWQWTLDKLLNKGLLGMCVGEKRKFKIIAKLGYGAHGSPPTISGGATLIFDKTTGGKNEL